MFYFLDCVRWHWKTDRCSLNFFRTESRSSISTFCILGLSRPRLDAGNSNEFFVISILYIELYKHDSDTAIVTLTSNISTEGQKGRNILCQLLIPWNLKLQFLETMLLWIWPYKSLISMVQWKQTPALIPSSLLRGKSDSKCWVTVERMQVIHPEWGFPMSYKLL